MVFCDLVDSTALSERLDPERFRDILNEYKQAVVAVQMPGACSKDVYDWFTEGFDTPILKEARTLLDELRA